MSYPKHIWDQLKGVTVEEIARALAKDSNWSIEDTRGATQPWRRVCGRRVVLHYHPGKTWGPKFLKEVLASIGWTEKEMKKLKLIK